jgi:hypothetical protein
VTLYDWLLPTGTGLAIFLAVVIEEAAIRWIEPSAGPDR